MLAKEYLTYFDTEKFCSLVFELASSMSIHPYSVLLKFKVLLNMSDNDYKEFVKVLKRHRDETHFVL